MPKDLFVFGCKILSTDSLHGCVIFSPTSAPIYKFTRLRLFLNVPRPVPRIFPIRTDLLYNPRPAVAQQCHKRLSQLIYQEIFVSQCSDEKLQIFGLLGAMNEESELTRHTK